MGAAVEEPFDVLIVGTGVSGIGAACRVRELCPGRTFLVVERRADLGGTWDLFRYPGIRSDSHLWGYSYPFKPWHKDVTIAPGPVIVEYMREVVKEHGLGPHIRFNDGVAAAAWSSGDARWHVTMSSGRRYSCQFLFMCGGYYDYDTPFSPPFEGSEDFRGRVIHPQRWPADADYAGRKVVVVGSGATAVTIVPVLARKAARVTMLQRSPSYVVESPVEHHFLRRLRPYMSTNAYFLMNRWQHILMENLVQKVLRWWPEKVKEMVMNETTEKLAGANVDIAKDFTPKYNVWDQRLCVTPDTDGFFEQIKSGKISIVTNQIDRFTENGVRLRDGTHIDADIIVTATGMNVQSNLPFSGIRVTIDGGSPVRGASRMIYKSCMLTDVPNFAFSFGYLMAGSWTQKSDLVSVFVCRLLNHMRARGLSSCRPQRDAGVKETPMHDFTSTYLARAAADMPKAGADSPWDRPEDYLKDWWRLTWASLEEKSMHFTKKAVPPKARL